MGDPVALITAVAVIAAGEWLVGHVGLFLLLRRVAQLPPSVAVRLAHVAGLALGYATAAFALPATSGVLICWGGAPLWPGAAVAGAVVVWLLLLGLLPPGFSAEAG